MAPVDERTVERLRPLLRALESRGARGGPGAALRPRDRAGTAARAAGRNGGLRGYEGLARALREGLEAFDYYHPEPEECALGGDSVVVTVRLRARGRQTGMDVDARLAHLFVFRGERAVRWEVYLSPQEALAAAGLIGWERR